MITGFIFSSAKVIMVRGILRHFPGRVKSCSYLKIRVNIVAYSMKLRRTCDTKFSPKTLIWFYIKASKVPVLN
jgi:hypothetical protein